MADNCVTLWIGESLGPVERACLRSVLRQGQHMVLYCYQLPAGVPEGVEVRDAAEVLPESSARAAWVGRNDLYSDWFRYELLRRELGTWLDTDVYLLRPIDLEKPYLFGAQASDTINNAVLRIPPESPLLSLLLEPFHKRTTPRWLPRRTYWRLRLREIIAGGADLTRVPWGTTSPHALTVLAERLGLDQWAEPVEVFYPMPWENADWIRDPAHKLEDVVTEQTVAVHLWNECIRTFKNDPAPAGSFLERLQREGAA
ncbi:MAG TPA: hypothetical protein VM265_11415 [Sphingomicrobium sp.]|nr:hypothetical protein [Sphingomicrobium sp.]